MKAHMIRVASGGSKSWGKRVATGGQYLSNLRFKLVREEGPRHVIAPPVVGRFWWASRWGTGVQS